LYLEITSGNKQALRSEGLFFCAEFFDVSNREREKAMVCNRHKKREGGKVVPVLNGLAKHVVAEANQLYNITSINFRFVGGCKGQSKVKIDASWWRHPGEVIIDVCDKDHGQGVVVLRTPYVAAVARHLGRRLVARAITVA
jgi:hypothetical protein